MSTVSKEIADKIVEGNGLYPGDRLRVIEIVLYKNVFDGRDAYKLIYETQDRNFIFHNLLAMEPPVTYWKHAQSSQNS